MSQNYPLYIDREAQKILEQCFPNNWIPREQNPDFHIDYYYEIFSEMEPTGTTFGVQLKGTTKANYTSSAIKYRIKTKHLRYYLHKVKHPVFIIVVDTILREGYWLFTQKWLYTNKINLENQDTITVEIPLKNKISNIPNLLVEIRQSETYMRENIWPSTIHAAVTFEKLKIEELDDRFQAIIEYRDNQTHVIMHAKSSVEASMQIQPTQKEKLPELLSDLIAKGKQVTLAPGEFSIQGSKLFDELTKKAKVSGISIHLFKKIDCEILLQTKNLTLHFLGYMEGGIQEFRLNASLGNGIILMSSTIDVSCLNNCRINVKFNLKPLHGLPLLHSAYLDELIQFCSDLSSESEFNFLCRSNCRYLLRTKISLGDTQDIREIINYINLLSKAKYIAERLNLNPTISLASELSYKNIRDIEEVYLLLHGNTATRDNLLGGSVSVEIDLVDSGTDLLSKMDSPDLTVTIPDELKYNILGTEARLPVLIEIGGLELTKKSKQEIRNCIARNARTASIKWNLKQNSCAVIKYNNKSKRPDNIP